MRHAHLASLDVSSAPFPYSILTDFQNHLFTSGIAITSNLELPSVPVKIPDDLHQVTHPKTDWAASSQLKR
jgi:hypothetical protein